VGVCADAGKSRDSKVFGEVKTVESFAPVGRKKKRKNATAVPTGPVSA
jgi:hypothetical protein